MTTVFKWHYTNAVESLLSRWYTHHKDKGCTDWYPISDIAREFRFGTDDCDHLEKKAMVRHRYVVAKNLSYWTWISLYV